MSSHRSRGLTAVLCAATAPAHPEELSGEGMVVAAFRAAQPTTRRPAMLGSPLAKGLVALVLAATGSTGVVLAAGAGALPVPWTDTPASPPETSRPATPSATPVGSPSDAGKPADTGGMPAPSTTRPDERPTGRPSDQPTPTEHGRDSSPSSRPDPPGRPETPGGGHSREAPAPPGDRQNGP